MNVDNYVHKIFLLKDANFDHFITIDIYILYVKAIELKMFGEMLFYAVCSLKFLVIRGEFGSLCWRVYCVKKLIVLMAGMLYFRVFLVKENIAMVVDLCAYTNAWSQEETQVLLEVKYLFVRRRSFLETLIPATIFY